MTRTFHVVTQRQWMRDELMQALTPHGWQVLAHHGLSDLPAEVGIDPDHVLWAPGAFVARQLLTRPLVLAAPHPWFLHELHRSGLLGRPITNVTVRTARNHPVEGFWKLADAKWDRFPARWRTVDEMLMDLWDTAELPAESLLTFCPKRLPPAIEYRAVIIDNAAVTVSRYLDEHGRSRDDEHFSNGAESPLPEQGHPDSDVARVAAFVTHLMPAIRQINVAPQAFVLDIGVVRGGGVVGSGPDAALHVVEANPAWCSAWYGSDLPAFAEAVAVAQGPHILEDEIWQPDSVLHRRAERSGPLPVDQTRHDRSSA
ncbi:MAG: hypothetical protein WKF57_05900 [Nakamurella sp.]